MKKLLLLFLCMGSVHADPYTYIRLIQAQGNTIEKVVDLLFEVHVDIKSPAIKGSKRSQKLLSPQEIQSYSPPVRALLSTLRVLGNKKDRLPIRLLWELDEHRTKQSFPNQSVLLDLGASLSHEFAAHKHKNIIFQDADNYRKTGESISPTLLFEKELPATIKVSSMLAPIEHLLAIGGASPLDKDLLRAKAHTSPHNFKLLQEIVKKYKEFLQKQLNLLKAHANQPVSQFIKSISKQERSKLFLALVARMEDIELLVNIFAAPEKHVIVYTGGAHAKQLARWLWGKFKFKEAIFTGMDPEKKPNLLTPFDANAFTYLGTDPRISWNIIKNEKPGDLPAGKDLIMEFNSENLDTILKDPILLKKVIKQYRRELIDIPNTFVKADGIPLLQYTLTNNYNEAAKILIQSGAKPSTYLLFIAIIQNKHEIVQLLLKHGAQPDSSSYKQAAKATFQIKYLLEDYKRNKKPPRPKPKHLIDKSDDYKENLPINIQRKSPKDIIINLRNPR